LGVVGGLLAVLVGLLVVVVLRPASPDSSALGQGSSSAPRSSIALPSPSASASDDWRSWPVWEVMPPAEMLPQLYSGPPFQGGEPRDDWRLPKTLQGWALNDQDYGVTVLNDWSISVGYEEGGEQGRVLLVDTKSFELPDAFNRYLRGLEAPHHVGRFTCGKSVSSKTMECYAYAEDTLIAMQSQRGGLTEQEIVAAMDELVDHLLATR
ncbi:hypothetical protein, partial [Tessaracoccus sp. OH4464_COT-324]|uniref:hypothetical protein n=1 Tax=Tessaracoccus sp. OH4464_COT-324 TaxID=2491059 RepID=UPI001F26F195